MRCGKAGQYRLQPFDRPAIGGHRRGDFPGIGDSEPFEPLAQPRLDPSRLGVGAARCPAIGDAALQFRQPLPLLGCHLQHAEFDRPAAPLLERFTEISGRALDRGGGIVELMREPRRQRSKRRQLVGLHQRGLGAPEARGHGAQQRRRRLRSPCQQLAECFRADGQHLARLGGSHRCGARRLFEEGHLAEELPGPARCQRHLVLAVPLGHLHCASKDNVERTALLALADEHLAGAEPDPPAGMPELARFGLAQFGKHRHLADQVGALPSVGCNCGHGSAT